MRTRYRLLALIALAVTVATAGIFVLWPGESPRATFQRYAGWGLPADAEDIRVAVRVGPAGDYVFSTFKLSAADFEGVVEAHRRLHGKLSPGGQFSSWFLTEVAPEWWRPGYDEERIVVLDCAEPGPLRGYELGQEMIAFDPETSAVHVSVKFYGDPDGAWSLLGLRRWLAWLLGLAGL